MTAPQRPGPTAVTGAGGFIGSALGRLLSARGSDTGAARGLFRREDGNAAAWRELGHEVIVGDLDDEGALGRLVAGAGTVIHLAARSRKDDLEASRRVNVRGTERLATLAANAGVFRLVYVSSISVLAATEPRDGVLTEADEPRGVDRLNVYSRTKLEAEVALATLRRRNAIPDFTVVRPTNVYGPGGKAWVLDWIGRTRRIPLVLGGNVPVDVVHVDDVARALVGAARSDDAAGRVLHIGHDELPLGAYVVRLVDALTGRKVRRLPGFADLVVRHAIDGGHRILHGSTRSFPLTRPARFPHEEARRRIGYEPSISLDEGLEALGRWYRESGAALTS